MRSHKKVGGGGRTPVHRSQVAISSRPPNNEPDVSFRYEGIFYFPILLLAFRVSISEVAMPEAVIVSSVRTPVGRAYKGSLRATRPDDLAALAIKEALARVPCLDAKEIDDVILGCAMPEGEQGMNVARIAALCAGLPVETSAMTINRFCSSGLQSIALAAERIRGGSANVIVAGGTESMSMVPMGGNKMSANPTVIEQRPGIYLSMGLTAERL